MCFYCDRNVKGNPQPCWYLNYVCWTCRVQNGVKIDPVLLKTKKEIYNNGRICYRCNNQMVNVGFKFRTPKKNNVKQWNHLKKTWENQYKYINGVETYVGPKIRKVKQTF